MATKPFSAKRILVTTDFSSLANSTLPMAKALLAKGGRLRLVSVAYPVMVPSLVGPETAVPVYDPKTTRHVVARAKKHLEALAKTIQGVPVEASVLESAQVAEAIMKEARKWKADLICISTHGRSALKRMVFGSVALKLMTLYPGRVVLLKPGFGRR